MKPLLLVAVVVVSGCTDKGANLAQEMAEKCKGVVTVEYTVGTLFESVSVSCAENKTQSPKGGE